MKYLKIILLIPFLYIGHLNAQNQTEKIFFKYEGNSYEILLRINEKELDQNTTKIEIKIDYSKQLNLFTKNRKELYLILNSKLFKTSNNIKIKKTNPLLLRDNNTSLLIDNSTYTLEIIRDNNQKAWIDIYYGFTFYTDSPIAEPMSAPIRINLAGSDKIVKDTPSNRIKTNTSKEKITSTSPPTLSKKKEIVSIVKPKGQVRLVQNKQTSSTSDPSNFKHHFIILLDRSKSMMEGERRGDISSSLNDLINKLFEDYLLKKENLILKNRPLCSSEFGDYLSFVGFGLNNYENETQLLSYQTKRRKSGKVLDFGFSYRKNFDKNTSKEILNKIKNPSNYWDFFSTNHTALSIALYFSLQKLKAKTPIVNKTYVALITDDEYYQSDNPSDEIPKLSKNEKLRVNGSNIVKILDEINTSFSRKNLKTIKQGKYSMHLIEFVPRIEDFDIKSIMDFDTKISLSPTPEGYEGSLNVKYNSENQIYNIKNINATLSDNNSKEIAKLDNIFTNIDQDKTIKIETKDKNARALDLSFFINYNDPNYNAHILHPLHSDNQKKIGLNKKINIDYISHGRILGLFPLSKGMYKISRNMIGADTYSKNLSFWNYTFSILLFLLTALAVLMYLKKTKYDTSTSNVVIKKGQKKHNN